MDLSHYTKKELVSMINQLEGPEVTTRPRKDTLIEILLERMPVEPVSLDEYKMPEYSMCDGGKTLGPIKDYQLKADGDARNITFSEDLKFTDRITKDAVSYTHLTLPTKRIV